MSRDSSTFKENYNRALDLIGEVGVEGELPTEVELCKKWDVSRTTVRSILGGLDTARVIEWSGRRKKVLRLASESEYFPAAETSSAGDRLTSLFMEHIFTGDLIPGTALHESELMKLFGVSSTVVREFLIRFSRFGLIEKERNRHWVLRGFTRSFADELIEVREMFERRAFRQFLEESPGCGSFDALISLRSAHVGIIENIETDYVLFPRLDERFHRVWIDNLNNRFVLDFFELISLVFHYHYRWNRSDEKERNHIALMQHLRIIDAVEQGQVDTAEAVFSEHLEHARDTLNASVSWEE